MKIYLIGILLLFFALFLCFLIEGLILHRPPGLVSLSTLTLFMSWGVIGMVISIWRNFDA